MNRELKLILHKVSLPACIGSRDGPVEKCRGKPQQRLSSAFAFVYINRYI